MFVVETGDNGFVMVVLSAEKGGKFSRLSWWSSRSTAGSADLGLNTSYTYSQKLTTQIFEGVYWLGEGPLNVPYNVLLLLLFQWYYNLIFCCTQWLSIKERPKKVVLLLKTLWAIKWFISSFSRKSAEPINWQVALIYKCSQLQTNRRVDAK